MSTSIINKKYLSTMIDRFFDRYQQEEQPEFVNFVKQWFKYSEESYIDDNGITRFSFWKALSNLEYFIDIDDVPNELLYYFMQHYANNFTNILENIPFFVEYETDTWGVQRKVRDSYGNIIYKYNNIRMFLKTARKFFLAKGSYYSFMYLFRLFGGYMEIVPLDKHILCSSNPNHLLSRPHPNTNRLAHLHGIDPDPYNPDRRTITTDSNGKTIPIRDWWYSYYSYEIRTNLNEEFYKPIILELVHPAGMKCVWKEITDPNSLTGWGYDNWGGTEEGNWGSLSLSSDPQINLSTVDIFYNTISENTNSSYRTIEISNTGDGDLLITSILLSDTTNFEMDLTYGSFPLTSSLPVTIQFGQSKTFGLRFTPKYTGNFTTTIIIESNSTEDSIKNIEIEGNAI